MKRTTAILFCAGLTLLAACKGAGSAAPAAAGEPKTDDEKTLYAMGVMLGGNVKPMALTPDQLAMVNKGFMDTALGKAPAVDPQTMGQKIQEFARSRATVAAAAEKQRSADFLAKAAQESGAVKTASGAVITHLTPGTGDSPKPTDTVKVHYTGTLIDGTEFDSSVKRGQPAEFPLTGVIPCWTEALQTMKVGGKAKVICPSDIAYGDQGRPPRIPGGATLVFDVELLEIKK